MAKLKWDQTGEHFFETGVSKGVLYMYDAEAKAYNRAIPWNGLTSVSESPTGAEANPLYADNIKYLNLISAEDFEATLEAYTYPAEFAICDGSAELAPGVMVGQQARPMFGLSYVTQLGNDVKGSDYGYKIHLIYGCTASPSERSYETINDSPDAITFSWDIASTPVDAGEGFKPTAFVTIDSTKVAPEKLALLEAALWGSDTEASAVAHLPLPAEIKTLLS